MKSADISSFLFGPAAGALAPNRLILSWALEPEEPDAFPPFALAIALSPRGEPAALRAIAELEDPFCWSALSGEPYSLWENVAQVAAAGALRSLGIPANRRDLEENPRFWSSSPLLLFRAGAYFPSEREAFSARDAIASFCRSALGHPQPAIQVLPSEIPELFSPLRDPLRPYSMEMVHSLAARCEAGSLASESRLAPSKPKLRGF